MKIASKGAVLVAVVVVVVFLVVVVDCSTHVYTAESGADESTKSEYFNLVV